MSARDSITAVVSLYNPDDSVVDHCAALLDQVGHVVVVDDGSPQDIDTVLTKLRILGCQVVRQDSNVGIASALNAGIRTARAHPATPEFVLTMDQDSLLQPGYTDKLLLAYSEAIANRVPAGMVAPGTIGGLPTRTRGNAGTTILGGEPIQSGLLIPCTTFDVIGLMMDELFIDGVDTEFYLRARNAGLESVLAPDAHLEHALGTMVTASIFGVKINPAGYPLQIRTAASHRYYYIFRNRLLLVRKYWRSQPAWAVKGLLADYRHLAIVAVLAPGRTSRLVSAIAGLRDGIRGCSGPRRTRNS